MALILASGSPRRKELLSLYTTDFTICVSDFDENGVTAPTPAQLVEKLARRRGRFAASAAVSLGAGMIFCNQSVAIVMGNQLLRRCYTDHNEQAVDMENSGIVLSALIPWNIACSIPLVMLEVNERAIPYAVLLYMIPLVYGLTKQWVYPAERQAMKE